MTVILEEVLKLTLIVQKQKKQRLKHVMATIPIIMRRTVSLTSV